MIFNDAMMRGGKHNNCLSGWEGFYDGLRRGFRMLPGKRQTKEVLVRWGRFQSEAPTDAEIAQWRRQFPVIDPVAMTGAPSGIVVLDCDGLLGYINLGKRGGLPETVIVETPRGEFHEHYWFRYPSDPSLGTIHNFAGGYDNDLRDVDLRADGGLARYPGAIHRNGRVYRFKEGCGPDEVEIAPLPDWLYEYIGSS